MDFLAFQVRSALVGNYKPKRLFGRGDEYAEGVIASAIDSVKNDGKLIISGFESKSGETVTFALIGDCLTLEEQTE